MEWLIPEPFQELFTPSRYKVYWGGRGAGKSRAFAAALIAKALQNHHRIGCFREFQTSIADSVHMLLKDTIESYGLMQYFKVTEKSINCYPTGSSFIFKGLHHNISEIRSAEGLDIVWIEEAQRTSKPSLRDLIPTIRAPGSEIWMSMNPENEEDPVYQQYILNPPPNAIVRKVNWDENPFFPAELDEERRWMQQSDPEAYEHVWNGSCLAISDAIIFRNRVSVESFETPHWIDRFYFGADFGFANDPSTLVRSFIMGDCLYIDHEAWGLHTEIDDLPELYDVVPGARAWPILGDCSRPETISYLMRRGFNIAPCEKWENSVIDGVVHLKGFRRIIVHERCRHTAQEFRLYKYKVDPKTEMVLPIIVDAHNHCIDALRYSMTQFVIKRGGLDQWRRFGEAMKG